MTQGTTEKNSLTHDVMMKKTILEYWELTSTEEKQRENVLSLWKVFFLLKLDIPLWIEKKDANGINFV